MDKDLVNLFKAMYKSYQEYGCEGGEFTAKLDRCDSVTQADSYQKVGNYQLLYKKRNGLNLALMSSYMSKKKRAASYLVDYVRVVSIN